MKYLIFLLLILSGFGAFGQELSRSEKEYNERANECYDKIYSGDVTALNLLGEFLSDETEFTRVRRNGSSKVSTLRNIALGILYYNCYFKGLPFDDEIDQETYENYINKNSANIFYFPQFNRFTDLDANNISFPHRIKRAIPKPEKTLDQLQEQIQEKKKKGHYTDMIKVFWEIGDLQTSKAEDYLLACAEGKHWGMEDCEIKEKVLSGIAFSLGNFRTERSLKMLTSLASNYDLYAMEDWIKAMARITNRDLTIENGTYDGVVDYYKTLEKELKTVKAIKESGYNLFYDQYEVIDKSPLQMVRAIEYQWWIFDNLKKDLIENKDPLVLHVISSRFLNDLYIYNDKSKDSRFNFFEKYKWARIEFNLTKMLEELTGVVIELNYKGEWKTESDDFEFNAAIMNYWKSHYRDYQFNKKTGLFENTVEEVGEPDMIKVHFENMHTDNDDLAMKAYLKLLEEDPDKVIQTMGKYDMDYIMGSLNKGLPMFTRRFLVQQCYLVDYCKKNNITYTITGEVLELLERFNTRELSFENQIELENTLYNKINLDNLVAIENYTITYGSRNSKLTIAVGHVLDQWYSNNIDLIINDSSQLKTYLYKSALYDRLGIVGVVNNYLRKLYGINPEKLSIFKTIAENDNNEDIRKNALSVINGNVHSIRSDKGADDKMTFDAFLLVKNEMDRDGLQNVYIDTAHQDSIKTFFDSFASESDPDVLMNYILLMDFHLHSDMVPYLINNYDRKEEIQSGYWGGTDRNGKRHTVNFTVNTGDYMVFLTEKTYDFYNESPRPDIFNNVFVSSSQSGPIFLWNKQKTQEFWLEKWKSDSENYQNWGQDLFAQKLEKLNRQDTISYDDIETVIDSRFWNEKVHASLLNNLVEKLSCEDLIKVPRNWNLPRYTFDYVIGKCEIPTHKTKEILEKFYRDKLPDVLNWLEKQVTESDDRLTACDKLNSICWDNAFMDSIKLDRYKHHKEWITTELKWFSDNTRSEFDQKYSDAFHIDLSLAGFSFKEKLSRISEIESIGVKLAQERIIRNATFEEIQTNWEQVQALIVENSDVTSEIEKKFGFFITSKDIENPDILKKAVLSGNDLSASYALFTRFYEIKKEDGSLDFEAIFNMMKYGNVDGFVGSGNWDWMELHSSIKYYISRLWEKELKEFAEVEYPDLDFDSPIVILNYMASKGYVASQKYVPVSFAKDKVVFIR